MCERLRRAIATVAVLLRKGEKPVSSWGETLFRWGDSNE